MGRWAKDHAAAVGRHPSAQRPHARSRSTLASAHRGGPARHHHRSPEISEQVKSRYVFLSGGARRRPRWSRMATPSSPAIFLSTMPPPPIHDPSRHRKPTPLPTNRKLTAVISEVYCCTSHHCHCRSPRLPASRSENHHLDWIIRSTARKEASHRPPLMSIS
jgi:hypothetical protein